MASSIARTATLFRKLLSGRRITYRDLEEQENINRRTALRWIKEAKRIFGAALQEERQATGEKQFWLDSEAARWIGGFRHRLPTPEEMAALDKAVQVLRREGLAHEVEELTALRSKVHGVVEKAEQAMKTDTDTEAILDSWGIVSRPGPHRRPSENVAAPLRDAILKQRRITFTYRTRSGGETAKTAAPAGLLHGGNPRLIALEEGKEQLAQYRLDRMSEVTVLEEPHALPEDALKDYLNTLFGSFGEEPVNVQWRFHPDAPEPETWTFHPTQKVEKDADGVVTVTFRAGGLDDMARHVIGWWDWIQVDKPKALRKAILRMRLAGLAQLLYEFADQRTATRIWNLTEQLGANKVDYWE